MASARKEHNSSQANLTAYRDEAQAASRVWLPPPRPSPSASMAPGRLVTLPARHSSLESRIGLSGVISPKSFSSKEVPSIFLVIEEEASVGSAMAARTVPMFFLFIDGVAQVDNASRPAVSTI